MIDEGSEDCADHNTADADGCSATCSVEDGYQCTGEPSQCSTVCGDGIIVDGQEECDDLNANPDDGCSDSFVVEDGYQCTGEPSQCTPLCGNPGGGPLSGDNGTALNETYCYGANDSTQIRAMKACESHFGVGACCIITGGYQDMQYGECNMDGGAGTIHWHWDNHPANHCPPDYVIGDVVSPGWCGVILGNFL